MSSTRCGTVSAQIVLVDDCPQTRAAMALILRSAGFQVQAFASALEFLDAPPPDCDCLITDISMPGLDGLALQAEIARTGQLPIIFVTGHGDVALAVRAMKAGAVDFIEKPFAAGLLLAGVEKALAVGRQWRDSARQRRAVRARLDSLTPREREVLDLLVQGRPNKAVAFTLGISPRTVEIHRARVMVKMQARSLSDLVRAVLLVDEAWPSVTDRAAEAAPRHPAAAPARAVPAAFPA